MKRDIIASFRLTELNKGRLENWSKKNGMSMSDAINGLIAILEEDIYIEHYTSNYQTDLLGSKIAEKIRIKEPIERFIREHSF